MNTLLPEIAWVAIVIGNIASQQLLVDLGVFMSQLKYSMQSLGVGYHVNSHSWSHNLLILIVVTYSSDHQHISQCNMSFKS